MKEAWYDELIGFENHLNVFHADKTGLTAQLAHSLTAYLTTSRFEQIFRQFNGHTRVNVTDLKALRYPSKASLEALGRRAITQEALTVEACDAALEALT
jgi:adenine-specific DNA-methyltransferase